MTHSITKTYDASVQGARAQAPAPSPRLRVLHHVDLARVGAWSHPDLALEDGRWALVGRKAPLFITAAAGDRWRPLDDPTISREQLRIRWLEADACFEVEPAPSSRRRLFLVDLEAPGERAPIDGRTRVRPGRSVAVDDRLLLGLEVLPRIHGPEDDRRGLVGEGAAMWRLRQEIAEVAAFPRPVLLLGETGTGKELVAGAIHRGGPRARGPFQTLNCAALPEALVESLLFGHAKGAFTGANAPQEGIFRAADGGTLFLDELAEMPLPVQPKLLRALQDGHVTALGRHRGVTVDVRLIAATHRDPVREVEAGRLRADLYHRLSAHVLHLPPLAARRFDIPSLFVHFLGRYRGDHPELEWLWRGPERWHPTIPLEFMVALMAGAWTGNVRELENVAERAARRNLGGRPFAAPSLPGGSGAVSTEIPTATPTEIPTATPTEFSTPEPTPTTAHEAESEPPSPELAERLRQASRLLGVAAKTLAKVVEPGDLAAAWGDSDGGADAAANLGANLRANPNANPTANPHANPTTNPHANPTANPHANPTANPHTIPHTDPDPTPDPALTDEALIARLEARLHARLHAVLVAHGFAQARVAERLGVSAWTLIRLMQRFDLARPTELSAAAITQALADAGGDLALAARRLEVSVHGLKKRLAELERSA